MKSGEMSYPNLYLNVVAMDALLTEIPGAVLGLV